MKSNSYISQTDIEEYFQLPEPKVEDFTKEQLEAANQLCEKIRWVGKNIHGVEKQG